MLVGEIEVGQYFFNGSVVAAVSVGQGDAGNVTIKADDTISLLGKNFNGVASGILSSVVSVLGFTGTGNGGNINLQARTILLKDDAQVASDNVLAQGRAGDINVNVSDSLLMTNGSALQTSTYGQGNAGNLTIKAGNTVSLTDGARLETLTSGQGDAGSVTIQAGKAVLFDGINSSGTRSGISSTVQPVSGFTGSRKAGDITIKAGSVSITNGAELNSSTFGRGNAGNIFVQTNDSVSVSNSSDISSKVETGAEGKGGDISIEAGSLFLTDGSLIQSSTYGKGNAGNIFVQNTDRDTDSVELDHGYIFSNILSGAEGNAGKIDIRTRMLTLMNGGEIAASVSREEEGVLGGKGKGGSINVNASDSVRISGVDSNGFSSGLFTNTQKGASGRGGDIEIDTGVFRIADGGVVTAQTLNPSNGGNITINTNTFETVSGGQVLTSTFSSGKAGNIDINAKNSVTISGSDPTFANRFARFGRDVVANVSPASGVFANTDPNSTGNGGAISLMTNNLNLTNVGEVSARSEGTGKAGSITINASGVLNANNSNITTAATQAGGGDMTINARNIRLRNNSDIRTNSGGGDGGNIFLTANTIVALEDSDILAFAPFGRGGNIAFNTRAFLSDPLYRPTPPTTDPAKLNALEGNNRVDVNASGAVSGVIFGVPDITFLQNSLTELSQQPIDANALIASSCIARSNKQQGTFNITGAGGLPNRPGDASVSSYPTGTVRNAQGDRTSRLWQKGDPIVEPQGVYQLPNGHLVLSRECVK